MKAETSKVILACTREMPGSNLGRDYPDRGLSRAPSIPAG
jgi:hypothetical protein